MKCHYDFLVLVSRLKTIDGVYLATPFKDFQKHSWFRSANANFVFNTHLNLEKTKICWCAAVGTATEED